MSRRGWVLFAAMGVIWGIPYLLIKVAVGGVSPPMLVFLRTATGALILLPFAARRGALRPVLQHWRLVALYTAVEIGVPWLLLSEAEQRLSSSLAGLLVAAVPLIGALLGWLTAAADRMSARQVAGLVVGFGGVAALVGLDLNAGSAVALAEMAVVVVCYAVGPMIIARRLSGVPALGVVTSSLVLAAVVYAPIAALQVPRHFPDAAVVASVAALGVVCTALAFLVFFALIAEVGPIRATVITYVNPAVALALGIAILHEPLTLGRAAGFLLIVAGSVLSTRRPRRRAPADTAPAVARAGV